MNRVFIWTSERSNLLKCETIAGMTSRDCKFRVGGVSENWDSFKDIPTVPQKS